MHPFAGILLLLLTFGIKTTFRPLPDFTVAGTPRENPGWKIDSGKAPPLPQVPSFLMTRKTVPEVPCALSCGAEAG